MVTSHAQGDGPAPRRGVLDALFEIADAKSHALMVRDESALVRAMTQWRELASRDEVGVLGSSNRVWFADLGASMALSLGLADEALDILCRLMDSPAWRDTGYEMGVELKCKVIAALFMLGDDQSAMSSLAAVVAGEMPRGSARFTGRMVVRYLAWHLHARPPGDRVSDDLLALALRADRLARGARGTARPRALAPPTTMADLLVYLMRGRGSVMGSDAGAAGPDLIQPGTD